MLEETDQCMFRSNWGIVRKARNLIIRDMVEGYGHGPGNNSVTSGGVWKVWSSHYFILSGSSWGRFTIACQRENFKKLHLLTYLRLHLQDWKILEVLMGAPEPFPQKNVKLSNLRKTLSLQIPLRYTHPM